MLNHLEFRSCTVKFLSCAAVEFVSSLEVKIPTFMLQLLLITLLLWSSNFDMCNARRGSWKQSRPLSASLLKKKGKKSHGYHDHNHHHSNKPKAK